MSYRRGQFWQPDVTVATVVVREDRLLMVEEEVRGRRVLNQPAGHLEPDESLFEAALRETLEETGWRVRRTRPRAGRVATTCAWPSRPSPWRTSPTGPSTRASSRPCG